MTGLLCGVLCGAVTFWSVSVPYFGLGLYGPRQLMVGPAIGAMFGALTGVAIALFELRVVPAVVAASSFGGVIAVIQFIWEALDGRFFVSAATAAESATVNVTFALLSSALTAGAICRLVQWVNTQFQSSGHSPKLSHRSGDRERIYRIRDDTH